MAEPAAAEPSSPRSTLVLYAAADEPFVRGFLLPALGSAALLDAREPLGLTSAELDAALQQHAVVVAIISAAFMADPWTRAAEAMAADATRARPELAVVPVVVDDVALPTHIAYRMTLAFQDRADWDRQAERLRGYLARPAASEPAIACPYPGIRPFQAGDAAFFRGRSTELSAIRTMITAGDRELYLVGPSGSGKSSLIQAGLLPQLPPPLVVARMRPGDAPLRQLAACLGVDEVTPAAIAAWAARDPAAQRVVFVDQLEELFALAPRAEHDAFAAALAALRAEPRVLVILALRADFYGELQLSPLWTDAGRRHVDLPPLRGAALREAIVEPARTQGVYLETALVERLLADAAGEPGVLPLLQETLVQLWGHRRRSLLTLAAYDALGDGGHSGLAVAVTTRADRCLAEL
ncbi:MAG TPA: TIR domain-containing protein, partial [Kofleriaceae bacterium]